MTQWTLDSIKASYLRLGFKQVVISASQPAECDIWIRPVTGAQTDGEPVAEIHRRLGEHFISLGRVALVGGDNGNTPYKRESKRRDASLASSSQQTSGGFGGDQLDFGEVQIGARLLWNK